MTVLQLCGFAIVMAIGVQSYCMSQEPEAAPLPDFPLIDDVSTLTASERALVELKTMHGAHQAYLNLKRKMLPSFGDSINWSVAELSESVPLTDKEIKVLEDALARRKSAKSSNLRDACLRSLEIDITRKDVALKLESDLAKSEFNSEKKLLETIDELLPPKKKQGLSFT